MTEMKMPATAIAAALRKAKPMTAPGTFSPSQSRFIRGEMVGWRTAVLKMADTLQHHHGAAFNRKAFNVACGAE